MARVDPDLLDALPEDSRKTFASLVPPVAASAATLVARLEEHVRRAEKAAAKNEFVDVALARAIADRLKQLLAAWDDLPPDDRVIVQAAIDYYALREDAEDDLDSVLGFDDDAQVLDACLHHLHRDDLKIQPG